MEKSRILGVNEVEKEDLYVEGEKSLTNFTNLLKENWSKKGNQKFTEIMEELVDAIAHPMMDGTGGEMPLTVLGMITLGPAYLVSMIPVVAAVGGKTAIKYLKDIKENKACAEYISNGEEEKIEGLNDERKL